MVDIGAEQAPLSDQERIALDTAIRAHNYPLERGILERAIAANPKSSELMVMWGRLAFLEGKAADSAKALQQADSLKPLAANDRVTLAMADAFSGKTDQAHAELQKLVKASPKNAEYVYMEGRIDFQTQAFESAAGYFQKAIDLNPNFIRAYRDLGECRESLGDFDAARKVYEQGVEHNRQQATASEWLPLDLGALLEKTGELEPAEKYIRESLKYNPRFSQGHYRLGMLLQKKNQDEEAAEEFRQAITSDPRYPQSYLALGRLYARMGKAAESQKALEAFQKLSEANERALKRRQGADSTPASRP